MNSNRKSVTNLRVALTHDYLIQFGGAERVLWSLLKLFPEADLYTALHKPTDQPRAFWHEVEKHKLITSFANKIPLKRFTWKLFLPIHKRFFENLDLSEYDLVISSSAGFAKNIKVKRDTKHISYIHTPPRYLWGYETSSYHKLPKFFKNLLQPLLSKWKKADKYYARKADLIIGNSKNIKEKIRECYQIEAEVIYPPIPIKEIISSPDQVKEDFFLTIGRLYPYKRIDLIVKTLTKLREALVIIGEGPQKKYLQRISNNKIIFKGFSTDEEKIENLKKCKAFIFATDEDFGIVMVEALAAGSPVIAYKKGGALEIIQDGKNGILFDEQNEESLTGAIQRFDKLNISSEYCVKTAQRFSEGSFEKNFTNLIIKVLDN